MHAEFVALMENGLIQPRLSTGKRWAVAVALFVAAAAARMALDTFMPGHMPFVTFFPAIALAALICSPAQSLTLLAASIVFITFSKHEHWTSSYTYGEWITGVFIVVLIVIGLIELLKGVNRKLRHQQELLHLLNRELRHRLKNISAMTVSIVAQAIRDGGDPEEIIEGVRGRVNAIVAAHSRLVAADAEASSLRDLVESVVSPLAPTRDRLALEGADVLLDGRDTTGVALVLHELATNAIKYGGWAGTGGAVRISWKPAAGGLCIEWLETVPLPIEAPKEEGFGSRLIRQAIPRASVLHEIRSRGAYCRIELPSFGRGGSGQKAILAASEAA